MDSLDIDADIDDVHGGDILVAEIDSGEKSEDMPMPTIESGMGLPLPADEDRQVEPALYHEQSQGGSTQSKLEQSEIHCENRNVRSRRLQHCRDGIFHHSERSC